MGPLEALGGQLLPTKIFPGQFLHSYFNHSCSKLSLIESNGWSPERRLGWNKLSNIHFMTICYMCCLVGRRGLGIKKEIQNTSCPSGAFVIWETGVPLSSLSAYCGVGSLEHLKKKNFLRLAWQDECFLSAWHYIPAFPKSHFP